VFLKRYQTALKASSFVGRLFMGFEVDDEDTAKAIENVLDTIGFEDEEERSYVRQLMTTAAKLEEDEAGPLELKILTNAMKEIRYAFRVFNDYEDRTKISVFGSARTDPDHANYQLAERFSELAVDRDYMVISGAGPGIMEAANKGAGREDSFGLNIFVPHEQQANPYIADDEKCINFRYFFSRKLVFSKESDAVVYFPGGFGTHDELFELLCLMQTGRHHLAPLILCDNDGFWDDFVEYLDEKLVDNGMISPEDVQLIDHVHTAEEALDCVDRFYRNFHGGRFIEDDFVIRFREFPEDASVKQLEEEFGHLCRESGFEIIEGPIEGEEAGVPPGLYRLVFSLTSHDYGELRRLVDWINGWTESP
jgi:uncharacterized protein (TIGR00730 family)